MKLFSYIIIIICIIIIFSCAYFKSLKEGLTNKANNIILMGDSVLNNSKYVSTNKSVEDILKKKINNVLNVNVLNVAKDGAVISDLYKQLDKIPIELNNSETNIFISIGGNDILKLRSATQVKPLFDKYMEFLKALRVKLGNAKIYIMNVYLPTNPKYETYKPYIDEWNQLIEKSSSKIGEMYQVVDLHSLLTKPEDFVYDIEPSESASEKIANLIYLY